MDIDKLYGEEGSPYHASAWDKFKHELVDGLRLKAVNYDRMIDCEGRYDGDDFVDPNYEDSFETGNLDFYTDPSDGGHVHIYFDGADGSITVSVKDGNQVPDGMDEICRKFGCEYDTEFPDPNIDGNNCYSFSNGNKCIEFIEKVIMRGKRIREGVRKLDWLSVGKPTRNNIFIVVEDSQSGKHYCIMWNGDEGVRVYCFEDSHEDYNYTVEQDVDCQTQRPSWATDLFIMKAIDDYESRDERVTNYMFEENMQEDIDLGTNEFKRMEVEFEDILKHYLKTRAGANLDFFFLDRSYDFISFDTSLLDGKKYSESNVKKAVKCAVKDMNDFGHLFVIDSIDIERGIMERIKGTVDFAYKGEADAVTPNMKRQEIKDIGKPIEEDKIEERYDDEFEVLYILDDHKEVVDWYRGDEDGCLRFTLSPDWRDQGYENYLALCADGQDYWEELPIPLHKLAKALRSCVHWSDIYAYQNKAKGCKAVMIMDCLPQGKFTYKEGIDIDFTKTGKERRAEHTRQLMEMDDFLHDDEDIYADYELALSEPNMLGGTPMDNYIYIRLQKGIEYDDALSEWEWLSNREEYEAGSECEEVGDCIHEDVDPLKRKRIEAQIVGAFQKALSTAKIFDIGRGEIQFELIGDASETSSGANEWWVGMPYRAAGSQEAVLKRMFAKYLKEDFGINAQLDWCFDGSNCGFVVMELSSMSESKQLKEFLGFHKPNLNKLLVGKKISIGESQEKSKEQQLNENLLAGLFNGGSIADKISIGALLLALASPMIAGIISQLVSGMNDDPEPNSPKDKSLMARIANYFTSLGQEVRRKLTGKLYNTAKLWATELHPVMEAALEEVKAGGPIYARNKTEMCNILAKHITPKVMAKLDELGAGEDYAKYLIKKNGMNGKTLSQRVEGIIYNAIWDSCQRPGAYNPLATTAKTKGRTLESTEEDLVRAEMDAMHDVTAVLDNMQAKSQKRKRRFQPKGWN